MPKLSEATAVNRIQVDDLSVAPTGNPPSGEYWFYGLNGVPMGENSSGTQTRLGGSLGVAQPTPTELTIASGAITVTQGFHKIDTEADAGTDDLDTINGLVANAFYLFKPENVARIVKFKHNTGNIKSPTLSDIVQTSAGVFGWSDGTNFYPITPSNPNDVDGWLSYPDSDLNFLAQDTTGENYKVRGDELRLWARYQFSGDISFDAVPFQRILFNSSTALTFTINASSPVDGMEWKVNCLIAPGAGNHKLLLPSGVTFDGTNRAALFSATTHVLIGGFISSTRFLIDYNNGVTFSAS